MLWSRRKAQHKTTPSSPTKYPHGTFIETEKGYFYILNDSKRYRLISERVLESWAPHRVVKSSEAAVSDYRVSAKMKFRNGSLIWNISDGKIYLIENGKRRWVKNPDWFFILGLDPSDLAFNMKKVMHVSDEEINLHEIGEELN